MQMSKLESANSALLILEKNPSDKEALNKLKENNTKLFNLYQYSINANSANKTGLDNIKSNDALLSDLIKYHKGVIEKNPSDSIYYKNLSLVEKAYKLIKEGKKEEAKNILITVPKTSAVAGVAKLLEHYTIK